MGYTEEAPAAYCSGPLIIQLRKSVEMLSIACRGNMVGHGQVPLPLYGSIN